MLLRQYPRLVESEEPDPFLFFPGEDGSTKRGHRNIGLGPYDSSHNDFLHRNGNVQGGTVHYSLTADEIPQELLDELARAVETDWPSPWKEAMLASIHAGTVIGTPISEYVSHSLANGRIALVGDAAHVATPMTGAIGVRPG